MATHTRAQTQAFERYYTQRLARAEAITPGQKIALINQLRRELSEQGRLPLASGPVRVDPNHPIVQATLEGRAVSLGSKVVASSQPTTISERMQALPVAAKLPRQN